MSLSKRVIETLIDLVEIKLSCMEVHDREDTREITSLENSRQELQDLLARITAKPGEGAVVNFPPPARRSQATA